ncbi:hypothetical protein KC361_g260 [Hortaea werneckii]|nr:hypothetical protein KC361_g260 [Hortaea werneckii]
MRDEHLRLRLPSLLGGHEARHVEGTAEMDEIHIMRLAGVSRGASQWVSILGSSPCCEEARAGLRPEQDMKGICTRGLDRYSCIPYNRIKHLASFQQLFCETLYCRQPLASHPLFGHSPLESPSYLFAPVTRTVKFDFSSASRGEASILPCGYCNIESTAWPGLAGQCREDF